MIYLPLLIQSLLNDAVVEIPLDSINQQYALWWFLPLLIGGGVGLLAMAAINIFGDPATTTFGGYSVINIAVLGPNAAGKTTLWNYFRGKDSSTTYQQTEGRREMSFKASQKTWFTCFQQGIGQKTDKIKVTGNDINGNKDFVRHEWSNMIESANMILFVFDAYKYIKSVDYQRDVNHRLNFIDSTIKEYKNKGPKYVWILGSRADQLSDRKEQWKQIIRMKESKPYRDIVKNNACLNLTNKEELDSYFNKMFE